MTPPEATIQPEMRGNAQALHADGQTRQAGIGILGGIGLHLRSACRAEIVKECVEAKEAEKKSVDGRDEKLGEQRVLVVQALVDKAADEGTGNGAHKKSNGQLG